MKIEKIQFDNVRYNPEIGAFETLVKIHDQGQTFSYPASVTAPLHAEYGLIVRGLAQAARKAHKGTEGRTRLHHAAPLKAAIADASQKSLLSRLLGNAAA
ncbi:hypothetical protein [Roseovarius nanhaiticus]|uniref:Uncharacterized protein n=1 Tax=Roseovarius nanhaiticus TaxID=573024 RepID=A0A1N7E6W3_9RHOB|nr:hypothetical protein [Roseovarius nanhaiticus]SEK80451.1 hypothetical protein SAMN05216208_2126 [Roseovarius nanhaiticus]SIR83735.1 hypothetical protein SAMN05421666_0008 [Roseovarius nanhaiticus]